MLPPITLPLLDPAGDIDPENDVLLIRQGLNDRKIAAKFFQKTNLGILPMLPSPLIPTDVIMIGRNNGTNYDNYIMPPQYLGFLNNTKCWFFNNTAPLGWTIIDTAGDRVLATIGPTGSIYNGPGYKGTWQQSEHTLTLSQIPAHSHTIVLNQSTANTSVNSNLVSTTNRDTVGGTKTSDPSGGGQPHDHGATWRPAAVVGVVCVKDKPIGG